MKTLIAAFAATIALSTSAQTIERPQFINQLSVDTCSTSPAHILVDTAKTQFDLAHALSFSWIALQTLDTDPNSYDDDKDADLAKAQEQWGLSNIKMFDNQRWNVRAMITDYEGDVFLTFRHTDSNLNWLLNADFGLWNFDHSFALNRKVHHGFATMLGSVWTDVVSELQARTQDGQKVHIFGHSLGGALALLSAPGLKLEGIDVAQVYATGSPKVGSLDWVADANQIMGSTPVYRVTNTQDLFSRIPVGETSLDEFRELFSFIPSIFTGLLDKIRYQMPYGLFGSHVSMVDEQTLVFADALTNDYEEQAYWQGIANQFRDIDENSNNIVDNVQQKAGVITTNLGVHLMRKENDGYTCTMTKLLKAGQ
ncbi:alpha/beta fold hydrolase [Pleionea sp. CnH1-48]|uniref:lipase family protein n=1 Tax=Pleionea sp. CnH1-48 TaxID=2954494 RepID=UPI002096A470|nr:lipase family protein [Pleionea sp. CnH1-48]MCO7225828.1 lipase family protein [Pleionea sp. CnH1-48]